MVSFPSFPGTVGPFPSSPNGTRIAGLESRLIRKEKNQNPSSIFTLVNYTLKSLAGCIADTSEMRQCNGTFESLKLLAAQHLSPT
jgi:hypothetical protein